MIEYRIESDVDPRDLAQTIREASREGWKLQGGISVTKALVNRDYLYTQALIKGYPE